MFLESFHGCWGASSPTLAIFLPKLYAVSISRNSGERMGGSNNSQLTIYSILCPLTDEDLESELAPPFLRYTMSCSSWPSSHMYDFTLPSFSTKISFHGVRIGSPIRRQRIASIVDRGGVGIRAMTAVQTIGRRHPVVIQGM